MANFPQLSTRAVTQYPLQITSGQASQVIRFLDGSDQRYLMQGRTLRRWQIKLNLLNEQEAQTLASFFETQLGDYLSFEFPDPYSGAAVPNCRFANSAFATEFEAVDMSATSYWVIEANG